MRTLCHIRFDEFEDSRLPEVSGTAISRSGVKMADNDGGKWRAGKVAARQGWSVDGNFMDQRFTTVELAIPLASRTRSTRCVTSGVEGTRRVPREARAGFLSLLISTRPFEIRGEMHREKKPSETAAWRFLEYRRHAPAIGKRETASKGEGERGSKEGERGEGWWQVSSTCVAVILAHSPGPLLPFQTIFFHADTRSFVRVPRLVAGDSSLFPAITSQCW